MARRALGPATLAAVQAVEAAVGAADHALLVACSGGPDSVALAHATRHVATRHRLPYAVLIVDHGRQEGSSEVAQRVRRQLGTAGFDDVEVAVVEVDPDAAVGPEAAAREARYTALDAAARSRTATVLLGHTLDDQAETVLLGLARGSGVRSISGMAVRSGHLLRPLLGLRRTVTAQVCAEIGWQPWADPQNADPRYARVRVRRTVLPVLEAELGPRIAEALARTAALARDDADLLDQLAAEADPGTADLVVTDLARLPPALRSRVLRRWLVRHGAVGLERQHLLGLERLVSGWHGQAHVDLPGLRVERVGGRLQIQR